MRTRIIIVGLIASLAVAGCANQQPFTDTQRGVATGAGLGALAGAAIGSQSANAGKGAIIGGLAGAAGGYLWSQRMENQKRAMQQATQGTGVQVTQTADNRLKVDIPSDISFASGSAAISPNLRPILDRFAASLNQNPGTTVTIIGHTDNTGSDAINIPLSRDRALSVRDYLVSRGVAANRIMADGRGSREPLMDNSTPANRARNRRVEIFVAEAQAQPQYPPQPVQQPYPQYPQQPVRY